MHTREEARAYHVLERCRNRRGVLSLSLSLSLAALRLPALLPEV